MNEVYYHNPLAADDKLGRVDMEGKVYETRFGPDKYVGWVDLESGKIYEARLGPDDYLGHVDPKSGKIYRTRLGPDEYLAHVEENGRLYTHAPIAFDDYVARVEKMTSLAHGGAAYMLLVIPRIEENDQDE